MPEGKFQRLPKRQRLPFPMQLLDTLADVAEDFIGQKRGRRQLMREGQGLRIG